MATEKQYIANRRNAQLSTGPGEAGKATSRMNAYRHGLTGQIDVRTPAEQEAHDKFCAAIVASLAPAEGVEHQFAQCIAEDHWRLNRARTIENNIFTLACSFNDSTGETESPEIDQALADARTFVADPARFQLLTIYERRIHSNMAKNMKQLIELQAIRRALEAGQKAEAKAQRAQALEEARLHTQLAEMEGVPCDVAVDFPNDNGFVFSTAEIAQVIRTVSHLKAAKRAESSNWAAAHPAAPTRLAA
jgi:predicted amidohydrolase